MSVLLLGVHVTDATAFEQASTADPTLFHYQDLPLTGTVDVVISQKTPSFEFHSGPSRYQAFRLPAAADRYLVDVVSFIEETSTPERSRVFYPIVALLTDDFLVSRTTDFSALRMDLPVFEYTTQPAYRLTVGIDPAGAHEQYLIVFTASALLAKPSMPQISDPNNAADSLHETLLGASAVGHLQIVLRPFDAPSKASSD